MFNTNNTVNSLREYAENNPLNNDLIWAIEYGEPSVEEIVAYCNELESFLASKRNMAHPSYHEAIRHHERVTEYLESIKLEEAQKSQETDIKAYINRQARITPEELEQKIQLLIEDENLTDEKLIGALTFISYESGIHNLQLQKYYEAKKAELERKEFRQETKRELNRLIKLEKQRLTLEDYIPEKYAPYIHEFCTDLDIRHEACLTALLASLSSCHHIKSRIVLSKRKGYTQPAYLYTALVAGSGSMKSAIRRKFAIKPLMGLQKQYQEQYDQQVAACNEAALDFKYLSKQERKAEYPEGLPLAPDRAKQAFITEQTVEVFAHLWKAYSDKAILCSPDELRKLFDSMNQYKGGKGSDEAKFLEMYDGEELSICRVKSEGNIFVDRSGLSIFGTIQPSILKNLWGNGQDDDGMWSRFLYVIQPKNKPCLPYEDEIYECPLAQHLESLFYKLTYTEPQLYKLTKSAYQRYRSYYNFLSSLAYQTSNAFMEHIYSKAKGQCGRLAMNLHVIEQFWGNANGVFSTNISEETIEKAIKLTNFYLEQVELLYKTLCEEDTISPILQEILNLSKCLGWITARNVSRFRRQFRNAAPNQIRQWFLELSELGYGEIEGTGSRLKFRVTTVSDDN